MELKATPIFDPLTGPFLITGSTGFIGRELLSRMQELSLPVHLLVRNPEKMKVNSPLVKVFKGDIQDLDSLKKAVQGCEGVFHLASYVDIWAKDRRDFYRVNVGGTENVCRAALEAGVKKMVNVSTAGTLGHSDDSLFPSHENSVRTMPFMNDYEASKFVAEERALRFLKQGLEVVTVYPPRVFGPGALDKSNGYTLAIRNYAAGKLRFIPGTGKETGNYAFIEDLIEGMLLAMMKGESGQRYLLGGENVSFRDFFRVVAEQSGSHYGMTSIPASLIQGASRMFQAWSWISGARPLVTPEYVDRFRKSYFLSCEKAKRELGYQVTPFPVAIKKTLIWLDSLKGHSPKKQG